MKTVEDCRIECEGLIEQMERVYGSELDSVADVMRTMMSQLAQREWISVEDRLPESEGHYLCWFGNRSYDVVLWTPNRKNFFNGWDVAMYEPRAWQPLPEPPKEDG